MIQTDGGSKKSGYLFGWKHLIMLQTESAPSSTEEAASMELQPATVHDLPKTPETVAIDNDEETTSQCSSEPKEAAVPSDKVRLNLLLVSGKKLVIDTEKNDTITQVKMQVLEQWPKEWNINAPTTVEEMNIIYLGKFLANETTLEANNIKNGRLTTVHLSIRTATNWKEDEAKKAS
ncbi:ubiquitin-related domain-containing protein [Umbelopsis sp. AD052]|nr:ubiquitin-related domain-containing protein [Umbelopsis sp. AD052]